MARALLLAAAVLAVACRGTSAWEFSDGPGRTWSGKAAKPKIICHVDACDSLWNMGIHDELVGYFGCVVRGSHWRAFCLH